MYCHRFLFLKLELVVFINWLALLYICLSVSTSLRLSILLELGINKSLLIGKHFFRWLFTHTRTRTHARTHAHKHTQTNPVKNKIKDTGQDLKTLVSFLAGSSVKRAIKILFSSSKFEISTKVTVRPTATAATGAMYTKTTELWTRYRCLGVSARGGYPRRYTKDVAGTMEH